MPPPAPSFPALENWQSMSESEQDALIARLEVTRRRGALLQRAAIGVTLVVAAAAVVLRLLAP
jgi:hypothetical protein